MWWGCHGLCFWQKLTELAHSFLFCPCVSFCLHGPFNHISFHKFSRQLSVFSLCSSSLISVLLVLSTICLFMKFSFSPDIIPSDDKASTAYGMEISAEKTKLMTNNTSGINTEIKVNGQKLETVTSFKYLGSVITDEGSNPEILSRTAQTTALTRLKPVWIDKSISLSSKIQLMHSFVTSIILYACESWTLTAELQRRIKAMEMRCYRKTLHISYKDHVTNEEVCAKIQQAIGPHEDLLIIVKGRKLLWYGHVSCSSGLAKTILQGTVKGGRRQGRKRKRWEDNIREWTGLEFGKSQRAVENRETWRKLVAKSSVVPQRPSRLRDWW